MLNLEKYEENLKKWSLQSPESARFVSTLLLEGLEIQYTSHAELTIKDCRNDCFFYEDHIALEHHKWASSLNLNRVEVLYVYGIGLGYAYEAVKEWLHLKPTHRLIFLEDDLRVITLFLQTSLATELLDDPQVRVYYWDWSYENISTLINYFSNAFLLQEYLVEGLNFYKRTYSHKFVELQKVIGYGSDVKKHWYQEYLNYGAGFLNNYFDNCFELPESFLAKNLYGKFKNIPAIICGAGPSLFKQIDQLKQLKDKGLIFAGGTAMNALNAHHMLPHFGVGIDPNIYQYTRIIANEAFETPFFYRNRLNSKALRYVSGPKLFINGSGGYKISEWFESALGIKDTTNIDEGFNVINLSVSLAIALGCRPIIFVGVDLAYTDGSSYSQGIFQHALKEGPKDFYTKSPTEELIEKPDIHGKNTLTLWKWINESNWFSEVSQKHPEIQFINATEGGIGFTGIMNLTLKETEKKFLSHQEDLEGKIHVSLFEKVDKLAEAKNVYNLLTEFNQSLRECEKYLLNIRGEYARQLQAISQDQFITEESFTHLKTLEKALNQEIAYTYLLSTFNESVGEAFEYKFNGEFEKDQSEKEQKIRRLKLEFKKNTYLWESVVFALNLLRDVLEDQQDKVKVWEGGIPIKTQKLMTELKTKHQERSIYSFNEKELIIKDPELGLDKMIKGESHRISSENPECYQYYQGLHLNGPSIYYFENKQKASESWFIEGKRAGKAWYYYPNGKLYALKRYKEGQLEGNQECYYENGLLKSLVPYKDGKIHGVVQIYYSNGLLRRQIDFEEGFRNGQEGYWNEDGKQLIQAQYKNNKPQGIAREWYDNGIMAKEISFHEKDQSYTLKRWEKYGGAPLATEKINPPDYFDLVTIHTHALTDSLDNLFQNFSSFLPAAVGQQEDFQEYQEKLNSIAEELQQLKKLQDAMNYEAGLKADDPKEPLWKSISVRREMEKLLGELLKKMSGNITHIQQILDDKFKKPPQNPP